jgi:hypothetical protein
MRREVTVTEEQIAAAFALVEKAKLPAGFEVKRVPAKPGRLGVLITGPQTNGHATGTVAWEPDLERQPVTAASVAGLVKSCQAWAKEPVTDAQAGA